MPNLASTDDIAARLGRDLTATEETQAEALLPDASDRARGAAGQDFTASETTDRLPVRGSIVRLPQRPVTAVDTVEDVDGNDVSFSWYVGDRIDLAPAWNDTFLWNLAGCRPKYVDVTYTHGYDEVPADVRGVVCDMVIGALGFGAESAGVKRESIDGAAGNFETEWFESAVAGLNLADDAIAVLDRYRTVGGSAYIGQ